MTYEYKYLSASSIMSPSPKQEWLNDFQANLDDGFYEGFDWYTIEEEVDFGSGEFQDVDVRVNRAIASISADKRGDDWKQILFKDIDHATGLGYLYKFDDNYWIVTHSEILKNIAATCTVRRCNNMLRWIDTSGAIYEVPCAIDVPIEQNRDYTAVTSAIVTPMGTIQVTCQYNSSSNRIKPNQRFLFGNSGNWTAWKVSGGGIQNYNLLKTADNTSAGYIVLSMERNYDNVDTDDLVNGIARVEGDAYTITLSKSTLGIGIAQTAQLFATVKLNGETVTRNVVWSIDTTSKATVSTTGLVTGVAEGTTTITCALSGNTGVNADCTLVVSASTVDVYDIRVSPTDNYVLEGSSQTFTVSLYKNDVEEFDSFTFEMLSNSIPETCYTYSVTGAKDFEIVNNAKYLAEPIVIRCVSGAHTKEVSILLKGRW
jgi:hypothetical protein